jgi:hypothetical protein
MNRMRSAPGVKSRGTNRRQAGGLAGEPGGTGEPTLASQDRPLEADSRTDQTYIRKRAQQTRTPTKAAKRISAETGSTMASRPGPPTP